MKKKIRNRIGKILEEQHISPYLLAKTLKVPPPTVYNWVKNKTNPSQMYIVDLMMTLGVTLDQILEVDMD